MGIRFHSAAQVGEDEIQNYFNNSVAPAARLANPGGEPALDDFRDQIVAKLIGDRENQEIEAWLKDARARTEIVYHEEAFR